MNNRCTCAGIAVALALTLTACGATSETEPIADVTTTTPQITTIVPSAVAAAPATDAPATTELATDTAGPAGSLAVAAFADANRELVTEWSANLTAFGDEALDYIDDVSKAPSATPANESSALMIAAIGPNQTDPDLLIVRKFADGMSSAITYAADGDQSAAMSVFIQLQTDGELLTSVLAQLEA